VTKLSVFFSHVLTLRIGGIRLVRRAHFVSGDLFSSSSRTCIPSHLKYHLPTSIDPAFLSTDFDIFTITEAVKAAQRFMAASPWNGFVLEQFGNFANVTTDEQIAEYARNDVASVFHPVGTALMSAANVHNGVVTRT